MQTLLLDTGDLLQVKSTDLPSAALVKLQPQDVNFLDITDPKAVLEKAFRNFSTLTKDDIFSFKYNDTIYSVAVLEVKPTSNKMGVCMIETDVSVDFAAPLGYKEPEYKQNSKQGSGTSTPRIMPGHGVSAGGMVHAHGSMAQAINYSSIAPSSTAAAAGSSALSSNFLLGGQKLNAKKSSKAPTPNASTPVAGTSTNTAEGSKTSQRRLNGPQPLRLPPNKLFFGYEIKPVMTKEEKENAAKPGPVFAGQGNTLSGKKRKGDEDVKEPKKDDVKKEPGTGLGRRLDGKKV